MKIRRRIPFPFGATPLSPKEYGNWRYALHLIVPVLVNFLLNIARWYCNLWAKKSWVLAKAITDPNKTSTYVTGLSAGKTTKLKINAYLTKGTKTYVGKAGTMLDVTTK